MDKVLEMRDSQLIFSGCVIMLEELLIANMVKSNSTMKAEQLLKVYRSLIKDPSIIASMKESMDLVDKDYGNTK
jgi:hypothetical protein